MKLDIDDPIERWRRLAGLLDAALELEPSERARYIDKACRAQPEVKAEIEALLARAVTPSFLDSGALVFAAPLLAADTAAPEGTLRLPEPLAEVVLHSMHDASASQLPPDAADQDVDSKYVLEQRLARGGMATVYVARDVKHDRRVAVKVLDAVHASRAGAERFVQEIRLTARLQHPNVLALLDSGVFESGSLAGRPYYVMPYVAGESLRARLARDGALLLPDAMRLLREVADALCYAHEEGVIHRDIKPENILLTRGHAVVADFGIAKAIAAATGGSDRPNGGSANDLSSPPVAATHSSTFLGTPAYMAPEQAAEGAHVDQRADLYAWGVVAYETLTGRHPFRAGRGAADLHSPDMADAQLSIHELAPSVPLALRALVTRCMAKAPADRPGSAAEVAAALDSAALDVRSGGAERTSPSASTRRARRGVMTALGLLIVSVPMTDYARMGSRAVVVVGTGNAASDVAAVQAAVDRADSVLLEGSFSFRQEPTKRVRPILVSARLPASPSAQVLVSNAVTVVGVADARGEMATIDGGTIPFYIDALGARVAIRSVRFVRPVATAIFVVAARDVDIASNRVDGIEPFGHAAAAIEINTSGGLPTPSDSGRPADVSGDLTINANDIDVRGGTAADNALGVLVWSVGRSPDADVALDIIGNRIRNTTSSAIMVRRANGRVRVLGNTIETSTDVAPKDYEVVRLVNTGSYQMARNTIDCRWANCVGIAIFSQFVEWPIHGAIVEDNKVNMLPPAGTVFADSSAAISIKGFARSNVVRYNTISGRARTALAVETWRLGYPEDNAFIDNHVDDFQASLASAFVGNGVLRTRLVHPGKVVDRGESTTIQP